MLADFVREVQRVTTHLPLTKKFILVNDGSSDDTLAVMKALAASSDDIFYLSFSRNFGKESAILAGLTYSEGDFVTLMDADLQDPPELLNDMYQKMTTENYDIVGCKRRNRQGEPAIRTFFANRFYSLINHISDQEIPSGVRDFRLMTRQVVDELLKLSEVNRFSKGLFAWAGFKAFYIDYDNVERQAGKSSWHFWQLVSYSIDGIVNFSDAPLNFATVTGFVSFVISLCLAAFYMTKTLLFGDPVQGFPTLIILMLLIGGLQLFSLGIIGKYIGKIFLETKHRPSYIIKEKNLD
ncbi:glucosyl transferase family 2 [Lactococcus insecticola]|uniref:Glucosyl transferase family 2 n=1 Tax=Pseudolactococcus insecticola TaxID=2709158 RepID=A0A6A0B744_9LACT|nr:glucosyl transferase family 2 [Lactococcus insecticola]